jgi:hypothetical protein
MTTAVEQETSVQQKEEQIQGMLERFAKAFTSGDGKGAAKCWEVPALVVSDQGNKAVAALSEVEAFFGGAAEQYNSRGIHGTRPEIQELTWFTDRLVAVRSRWPYLDAAGAEVGGAESSTYLARFGDDDEPRISVAIMMGTEAGE